MSRHDRRLEPDAVLREAAADLPENQPGALSELARVFPELSIEAAIGRGGSGVVYRVRQTRLGRLAALKILDPNLVARDPSFVARLAREGRAMAQLDHPGILKVYDFGEREGRCYLLTEYVDGIDLRKLMAMGALQPSEALRLVPPICEALQYAHDRGIVHRDIKPENVLLDVDGHVKLADFGLARLLPEHAGGAGPQLTRESQVMGTPHYMAPEQWRGAAVDHRADIFALGVVLYELLTGQVPAGAFTPPSACAGVPRRLDEIVRRALAQDPLLRYQRAAELGHDVREQASASTATREPAPEGRQPVPAMATRRSATGLLVGAVVAMVAALGVAGVGVLLRLRFEAERAMAQASRAADAARIGLPLPSPPRLDEDAMPVAMQAAFAAGVWSVIGLAMVLGFRAIARIRRGGPPFPGMRCAVFMAWFVPVAIFDVCVMVPLANSDNANFAQALGLVLLAPLNLAFFVWRYRAACTPPFAR